MQHEIDVAADFFLIINEWLIKNIQHYLMWNMLIFYIAKLSFYVADVILNVANYN
jgi:hypothetical protein